MEVKKWADYLDSNGLVTQKQSLGGDGGDSLQRSCSKVILELLPHLNSPGIPFETCLDAAEIMLTLCADNRWRRSWHPDKWYSTSDRTSRDQLTPLVIMLGLGESNDLWPTFKEHLKRGLLFAYNTRRNFVYPTLEDHNRYSTPDVPWDYSWKCPDITGPEFWALYIRGFRSVLLCPMLYVFDLHTLFGSIVIRFNKQDDVINHALILEFAKVRMDTVWMKLARKITPRALLQERLDRFFGPEIEPPINEFYARLVDLNQKH
jgi:hypothetical protein